jgi:hypothetical protein
VVLEALGANEWRDAAKFNSSFFSVLLREDAKNIIALNSFEEKITFY